jgi:aminomethyltransferase
MTEGEFSPLVRKENSVSESDLRPSPLDAVHVAAGAAFTGFAGWKMPVRYGSDLAEHETVRTAAGLFDLSHMAEFIVQGTHAAAFLDYALAGQASVIAPGRA